MLIVNKPGRRSINWDFSAPGSPRGLGTVKLTGVVCLH